MHKILAILMTSVFLTGYAPQALAWGCVAEAEDGASGWSNSYDSMRAARKRALEECAANTSEECEITDCNEDW